MRRFTLLLISGFLGISILTNLGTADVLISQATKESNSGIFFQALIELVRALVTTVIIAIIWITDLGYSLNKIGGLLEEKANALGQNSEGTSSEV